MQRNGFLIDPSGLVVTNYHAIKDAYDFEVVPSDGKHICVMGVAAANEEVDIAVLKVAESWEAKPLRLARLALPSVGAKVLAIGNPLGLTNTLSDGILSGQREEEESRLEQAT